MSRRAALARLEKTAFIREWWDEMDDVTLITRPRRFGKTLNMSTVECFFSNKYTDRGDLFEGLEIWKEERFRRMQGTYPVLFLSFADVMQTTFAQARNRINQILTDLYIPYDSMLKDDLFTQKDRQFFREVNSEMPDSTAAATLKKLTRALKVISQAARA